MNHPFLPIAAVLGLALGTGCAKQPMTTDATSAAQRGAEEAGAQEVPQASLALQLSTENLAEAQALYEDGKKDEAASMLLRSEADASRSSSPTPPPRRTLRPPPCRRSKKSALTTDPLVKTNTKDMNMTHSNLLALALVGTLLGCAAHSPNELVSARRAYTDAMVTEAPLLAPAELHVAKVALEDAEAAFEKQPRDYHTADLAYVAERKAQMAGAKAAIERAKANALKASSDLAFAQEKIANEAKDSADAANASLGVEQDARRAAELREQAALAALAEFKKEDRGLVLTLSGSVLFKSGESTLLPEAQTRLGQVGTALLTAKDRSLVIEGHTDSQGTDGFNQDLSQRRAEAVKTYLVSLGYKGTLIQAAGIGETRPLADNATAEGRANNRRVEIVVKQ
jgi:outer membrane protein OmpA-like peptidoglycan-associated protein